MLPRNSTDRTHNQEQQKSVESRLGELREASDEQTEAKIQRELLMQLFSRHVFRRLPTPFGNNETVFSTARPSLNT
jgi:hypothetical protein